MIAKYMLLIIVLYPIRRYSLLISSVFKEHLKRKRSIYVWSGHLKGKNYGLGPVGFPRYVPSVATLAVPL